MEGLLAIEHNRDALKRIVAALVALMDFAVGATLPRHLLRSILRLLRPAEAAARRLVIALARGIAVTMPARRHVREARPAIARFARTVGLASLPAAAVACPRPPVLPLLDPLRRWRAFSWTRHSALPRISVPGFTEPAPLPVRAPASPDDPMDATPLSRRLQALGLALEDLPRHALRFARWQARRRQLSDADPARRRWPLRPGRPPGWRRKASHEVYGILDHANQLAHYALEHPDTS